MFVSSHGAASGTSPDVLAARLTLLVCSAALQVAPRDAALVLPEPNVRLAVGAEK